MSDTLNALRQLHIAVKNLGERKNGKTLFELSPISDEDVYRAWLDLNEAQKKAESLLAGGEDGAR